MTHLLVVQLRFVRRELVRCLEGVSEEDGGKRVLPMNCISWVIGHLASQENYYWNLLGQNLSLAPGLRQLVGFGQPPSTPSLAEMWETWQTVTRQADVFLDTLTPALMQTHFVNKDKPAPESIGTMLLRNIYHYWFHTGEAHAMRQVLGHPDLPQFVGDMTGFTYYPEIEKSESSAG